MATNDRTTRKGIDTDRPMNIPDGAHYLGRDGEGADHFWWYYTRTIYVADGADVESFDLPAEYNLLDYAAYIADHHDRGEWDEYRVTEGGLAGLIDAAAEGL